jgi:hypothetical protein
MKVPHSDGADGKFEMDTSDRYASKMGMLSRLTMV